MKDLYAKVTDKSIFEGVHKVSNFTENVILVVNGEQMPFKEHEIEYFCDENGNKIFSLPERCEIHFDSVNKIDNEFHMYVPSPNSNKISISYINKESDYLITAKMLLGMFVVEFKNGNDVIVENYSITNEFKFIHLLRKHNMENLHKKFLKDGLINSLI